MKRERPENGKRPMRAEPRLVAVSASLVGHLIIVLGLLSSGLGKGDLITGQGLSDDGAMTVSLVGSSDGANPTPAETQTTGAEAAAQSLLDGLTSKSAPARAQAPEAQPLQKASLDELLAERPQKPTQEPGRPGGKKTGEPSASGAPSAAGGGASAGRLWAVIAPCWRRMPQSRGAFVRLQVELDGLGRLSKPPRVIRTGEMTLDGAQLLAEAQALEALSACLPNARTLSLAGGHVLDFRDR